jgi:hypothetical protein
LTTSSSLVLEGVALKRTGSPSPNVATYPVIIKAWDANALHVLNCRLTFDARSAGTLINTRAPTCAIRNSELYTTGIALGWSNPATARGAIENCVSAVGGLANFHAWDAGARKITMQIRQNTSAGKCVFLGFRSNYIADDSATTPTVEMEFSRNIIGSMPNSQGVFCVDQVGIQPTIPAAHFATILPTVIKLREQHNVYAAGERMLQHGTWDISDGNFKRQALEATRGKDLADWNQFWGLENSGSVSSDVRFQGGDLNARAQTALEQLTAEDFRLRPDSAGYRAGPDGKDLGADVDLVGPGAAYERWKKTPEYQEWLKETGQLRAEAPKPESKAFVVLTRQGIEVRKFDTLAEAVQVASDGDTIEIRGNGPFDTPQIKITKALSIRAAVGFRPVIERDSTEPSNYLIESTAPLVLEGLGLRWLNEAEPRADWRHLVYATKALHAANCQFVTRSVNVQVTGLEGDYPLELRNCEFLASYFKGYNGIDMPTAAVFLTQQRKAVLENCVLTCHVFSSRRWGYAHGAELRLTHDTVRTPLQAVRFNVRPGVGGEEDFGAEDWTEKALQVEASGNLIAGNGALMFAQQERKAPLPPGEAENLLARMVGWRGERNAYACGSALLWLELDSPTVRFPSPLIQGGLAGWKKVWGTAEEGSIEGKARFAGGDPLAKASSDLLKMTPDDFRLRPDRAGYRAGPDGKDLGADVDLVGPGPAYERWKKTPEYQEWLKDTGQQK